MNVTQPRSVIRETAFIYRCDSSVRFVFLDPLLSSGDDDSIEFEFFLWHEIAHQRF